LRRAQRLQDADAAGARDVGLVDGAHERSDGEMQTRQARGTSGWLLDGAHARSDGEMRQARERPSSA
jgi:hypothetical protein